MSNLQNTSDTQPHENRTGNVLRSLAVCLLLLLAVAFVFGQTLDYEFINLDDDVCVSTNPWVQEGLTASSLRWAFANKRLGNWDPITWMSHMIDWELFGDNAGGHHLTNVLLHAATTVVLFLLLLHMTGAFWPSALAGALFAIHPLRVESVAWVTERKDVLSGLFFVLALAAYAGYARCRRFAVGRYIAAIVLFALGLMSKPMLVTLPFVLLLLDYWPLGRFATPRPMATALRLTAEKIPFFALSAACCVATVFVQHVSDHEYCPWKWRIGDAAISYASYLIHFFYPVNLAPLRPRTPFDLPWEQVVGACLLLLCVSVGVLLWARKRAYLPVGWFWFVGMLFPVIGFVPFGTQAMADRFTYLPQIGLCIALAWGAADICRAWPKMRWLCSGAAVAAVVVLAVCARRQTTYWRDSETLWNHTLACTSDNHMAHDALGNALADKGRLDEAEAQYRKAIKIQPAYASAHFNLGVAAARRGHLREAISHYRKATSINNNHSRAHNNLADALLAVGLNAEAAYHARMAISIAPDYPEYHFTLGNILLIDQRFEDTLKEYEQVLAANFNSAECHIRMSLTLIYLSREEEAAGHYRRALEIRPDVLKDRPELEKHLREQFD